MKRVQNLMACAMIDVLLLVPGDLVHIAVSSSELVSHDNGSKLEGPTKKDVDTCMYMCIFYLGSQVDVVRGFPFKVVGTELVSWVGEAVYYVVSPCDQYIPVAGGKMIIIQCQEVLTTH